MWRGFRAGLGALNLITVVDFFVFTFSEKFVNASPDAYAALIPITQGEL